MKSKQKKQIIIVLIFIFYLIIAYGSVPAFDDFRWGTSVGANRLASHFDNYNGRYLGNYIILLITRSNLAKGFLQAAVNTGIVFVIYKILNEKIHLLAIMFFFVSLPIGLYTQTYAWMSGFANYNVSTLLILAIVYLLRKKQVSWKDYFLLFLSGLSVQLFLENVSAINIGLTALFLIYSLVKKDSFKKAIILFSSNLIGTLIMFSNTAYISDDTSRGLSNISLAIIPRSFLTLWSEFFFKKNIILLILLAVALYLHTRSKKQLNYMVFPIPVYFTLRSLFDIQWNQLPTKLIYLEGFLVIFFLLLALFIIQSSKSLKQEIKNSFYFFFLLAGLYAAPILVLSQNERPLVSPRNVISSYILILIAILHLYLPLITENSPLLKSFGELLPTLVLSLMLVISSMSVVNGIFDYQRIESMQEAVQKGETEIEVAELPFRYLTFAWGFTDDHLFMPNFKEYYHLPEHVIINEVPRENSLGK